MKNEYSEDSYFSNNRIPMYKKYYKSVALIAHFVNKCHSEVTGLSRSFRHSTNQPRREKGSGEKRGPFDGSASKR